MKDSISQLAKDIDYLAHRAAREMQNDNILHLKANISLIKEKADELQRQITLLADAFEGRGNSRESIQLIPVKKDNVIPFKLTKSKN